MEYERFNTVVVEYKNSIEAFMRRVFQVLIIWVCILCCVKKYAAPSVVFIMTIFIQSSGMAQRLR